MPQPKPTEDEQWENFRDRCMADEVMNEEYSENDQRLAVCASIYEDETGEEVGRASEGPIERVERETDSAVRATEGGIEGYAVTWAYDEDGIRFHRGSFSKTIAERAGSESKIPLLVRHDSDGSSLWTTVGWVREGTEDEKGLLIRADFLDDDFSQAVRERAKSDGIRGMSVNAKSIKGEKDAQGVLQTTEALLREVTLTNVPKDPESGITAVRGEDTQGTTPEEEPAEATPAEEPEAGEQQPPDGTAELDAEREDVLRELDIALAEVE